MGCLGHRLSNQLVVAYLPFAVVRASVVSGLLPVLVAAVLAAFVVLAEVLVLVAAA